MFSTTATSVQSAPSASAGSINRDQKLSANRRDYRTIHAFTNGPDSFPCGRSHFISGCCRGALAPRCALRLSPIRRHLSSPPVLETVVAITPPRFSTRRGFHIRRRKRSRGTRPRCLFLFQPVCGDCDSVEAKPPWDRAAKHRNANAPWRCSRRRKARSQAAGRYSSTARPASVT
jgi:hypothetical protein